MVPETKVCSKCGQRKELIEFYRNKKSKDGFAYQCKQCADAYSISYRDENKEKLKAYIKARYVENKEKQKDYLKSYREANKEKLVAKGKAYCEANKEKRGAYLKSYYASNKDKQLDRAKSWREESSKEINDSYCSTVLNIRVKDATPEILELKRQQLKLHRLTKQLKKEIKNV